MQPWSQLWGISLVAKLPTCHNYIEAICRVYKCSRSKGAWPPEAPASAMVKTGKMMDTILRLLHCLFLTPLQTPPDQNSSVIGTMTLFVVPKVKLLWVNTKSYNLMAKHAAFTSVMILMAPCLKGILMYPASVHMEFQSSYEVCHVIYVGGSSGGLRSEYMKSLKLDNPVVLVLMSETMK